MERRDIYRLVTTVYDASCTYRDLVPDDAPPDLAEALDRFIEDADALRRLLRRGETGGGPTDDEIDTAEAARLLGLSDKTVRLYAWRGQLPARKVGNAYVFARQDIHSLARKREGRTRQTL